MKSGAGTLSITQWQRRLPLHFLEPGFNKAVLMKEVRCNFNGNGFEIFIKNQPVDISRARFVFVYPELIISGKDDLLSIRFSESFLQPYVDIYPALATQNFSQFVSFDMAHVIHKIIQPVNVGGFAPIYIAALVHELVSLVVIRLSLVLNKYPFPVIDLVAAESARGIIMSDFEVVHTVEELSRKTGTTEIKLQAAFKHLYGTSVGKFSREARLEKAYQVLKETSYPLRVVCEMVGYPDASNFSLAFKKQFGFWPGRIQKKK